MSATVIEAPLEPPPYDLIDEIDVGGLKVAVVRAALELDLFTAVAGGASSVDELSTELGCSIRGMRTLVRALLSIELLDGTQSSLRCSPTAAAYLARGGKGYAAPIYLTWLRNRDRLVDAIRTGQGPGDHADADAEDDWCAFAAPDLVRWPAKAAALADRLTTVHGINPPQGARILDLGCGSGIVGFSLAQRFRDAQVVAIDRHGVIAVARQLAREMGVEPQVTLVAASIEDVQPPAGRFDAVLLVNVAQYLDDDRLVHVLETARTALRPGGQLLLATPLVDDGSPGNVVNYQSAIEMYLASSVDQRDEQQVLALLAEAGFDEVARPAAAVFVATLR